MRKKLNKTIHREGKWCATRSNSGSSRFDSYPEFLLSVNLNSWVPTEANPLQAPNCLIMRRVPIMLLKKRDLLEVPALFELSIHPEVYPYLRHKANTIDEFYFLTKQMIEAESNGFMISRTIIDQFEQPIGIIHLFDIHENSGFLATWIGQPYFGKGYNQAAKQQFFDELFFTLEIETVYMKIRKTNIRSLKAISKFPYVTNGNQTYQSVYENINRHGEVYDLYMIKKEHYASYVQFSHVHSGESEDVVS